MPISGILFLIYADILSIDSSDLSAKFVDKGDLYI